jgi:hypothetical protein
MGFYYFTFYQSIIYYRQFMNKIGTRANKQIGCHARKQARKAKKRSRKPE